MIDSIRTRVVIFIPSHPVPPIPSHPILYISSVVSSKRAKQQELNSRRWLALLLHTLSNPNQEDAGPVPVDLRCLVFFEFGRDGTDDTTQIICLS